MWQHGQVFKLKAKSIDGQALWAYRYRVSRGAARRGHRLAGSRLALTR
jgi:hypothetical protein